MLNFQKTQAPILIIGDAILDRYITGVCRRISPEAPVPIVAQPSERSFLGGGANLALNIASSGLKVDFLFPHGANVDFDILFETQANTQHQINRHAIFVKQYGSPVKTRIYAENHCMLRIDDECDNQHPSLMLAADEVINYITRSIDMRTYACVVISDYGKGAISSRTMKLVIANAVTADVPVFIDSKTIIANDLSGSFLFKPNLQEAYRLFGFNERTHLPLAGFLQNLIEEKVEAIDFIRRTSPALNTVITMGGLGCCYIGPTTHQYFPGEQQQTTDVSGAGDSFFAGLIVMNSLGLSMSSSLLSALEMGRQAVLHKGTYVSKQSDYMREYIRNEVTTPLLKASDTELIEQNMEFLKGQLVVFTNGCFDIIHHGHIEYLRQSRLCGDFLIIGLNSDHSVQRLKGFSRPVNSEQIRASNLLNLPFVDMVIVFEDDTPESLIKIVKPTILTKGGDYTVQEIIGSDFVLSRGGKVLALPFIKGNSTTDIIRSVLKNQ